MTPAPIAPYTGDFSEYGSPRWLTIRDARRLLGVSRQRIHQLIADGRIETTGPEPQRVSHRDVLRILDERQREGA